MSTPSPIAVKKTLDAKRASDATQQEKARDSKTSASSRKGKASGASKSTKTGSSGRTARSPRKATPKNSDQRPFIERNPHLTQKLDDHEGLQTLLSSMNATAKQSTNKKENN